MFDADAVINNSSKKSGWVQCLMPIRTQLLKSGWVRTQKKTRRIYAPDGMVNVDLVSAIITKVSNALNTLVSGQALSKGLIVLLPGAPTSFAGIPFKM